MATIKDHYGVYCKKRCIASYYIYTDGTACYFAAEHAFRRLEGEDIPDVFKHSLETEGPAPFMAEILTERNRVPGQKKPVYKSGNITVERIARETGEKFWVYRQSAEKGGERVLREKPRRAPL